MFPFYKLYFLFSCVTDGYQNESTIKTHENSYRIYTCYKWSEGRLASIHSRFFKHARLCSTWHMVLTCPLVGWVIGIYTGLFPVFQRLSYPNWKEKRYSLFKTSLWSDCKKVFPQFLLLRKILCSACTYFTNDTCGADKRCVRREIQVCGISVCLLGWAVDISVQFPLWSYKIESVEKVMEIEGDATRCAQGGLWYLQVILSNP